MKLATASMLAACWLPVVGCSTSGTGGNPLSAGMQGLQTFAGSMGGAMQGAAQGFAKGGAPTSQPVAAYPSTPPSPTDQSTAGSTNTSSLDPNSKAGKISNGLATFGNITQALNQQNSSGGTANSGLNLFNGISQGLQNGTQGSASGNSSLNKIGSGMSILNGALQATGQQSSGNAGGAVTQPGSPLATGLAALGGAAGATPQNGKLAAANGLATLIGARLQPVPDPKKIVSGQSIDSGTSPPDVLGGIAGLAGGKTGGWLQRGLGFANAANNLKTFFLLSTNDEKALGQSVGVSLTNKYPAPGVDPFTKYVTLVGSAVVNTSPRPDIRYVFGVLNTPEINAFSGPGGYVFVTRGALGMMKDESELAGVLAHEISHVILQHGLNQVKVAAGEQGAMQIVQLTNGKKVNKLTGSLVTVVTTIGYTQQQEFDADKSAVDLMHAAGYDPASYQNFLQRLAAIQTTATGGPMSTHPGAAQRVAAVSAEIQVVGGSGGATLADRLKQNIRF